MEVKKGLVTLIGAGPGDPGLLTQAGRAALEKAQVVLYDRLAGEALISLIPEDSLKINVGKNFGNHPVPQSEINSLLLRHALAGKRVVRLKGGDPFLFGRGSEEVEALRRQGIKYRVIPGVSSALGVPAVAGIPVTHRDFASSIHILTGHGKGGKPPDLNWRELARLKGTLIFLMGLSALSDIRDNLLAAGMSPDVPAALIENGTLPEQRRLLAPLAGIPELALAENVVPPSLLVVGEVCSLAAPPGQSGVSGQEGKRILAVGSDTTAGRLASLLRELVPGVDELATIYRKILPQPEGLWERLESFRWIAFTSPFGAGLFFRRLREREIDIRRLGGIKFAVTGPGTAEAVRAGGITPDYLPDEYGAEPLARGLLRLIRPGEAVLLYRALGANRELDLHLKKAGLPFEAVNAYRTLERESGAEWVRKRLARGGYAAAAFTSPSAVKGFARLMEGIDWGGLSCVCLGETTARTARDRGLRAETAAKATIEGLAKHFLDKERLEKGWRC
ncbi:MAG: uroporphyrinogen-III C-methyltransferase [Planctomycetota bacterium]|jgi:uroporphyrinogen III methyltransferase/synthase|nr:uroporphyrinogen-III C-methyltransferase [Planctomycetota bacterium]